MCDQGDLGIVMIRQTKKKSTHHTQLNIIFFILCVVSAEFYDCNDKLYHYFCILAADQPSFYDVIFFTPHQWNTQNYYSNLLATATALFFMLLNSYLWHVELKAHKVIRRFFALIKIQWYTTENELTLSLILREWICLCKTETFFLWNL